MGVDELGVEEMGIDEIGSNRSGTKPYVQLFFFCCTANKVIC